MYFENKNVCNYINYRRFLEVGEPEGTRTPNLLIRSEVHYPIMLQVHFILR